MYPCVCVCVNCEEKVESEGWVLPVCGCSVNAPWLLTARSDEDEPFDSAVLVFVSERNSPVQSMGCNS